MLLEITVTFLKNKDGKMIGVSLVPEPHTESEEFCSDFRRLYRRGNSKIFIEEGKITFEVWSRRIVIDSISDAKDLDELLRSGKKLELVGAGFLTPGFSLNVPDDPAVIGYEYPVKKYYT